MLMAMANHPAAVTYTLRVSLSNEAMRRTYIAWLAEDHLAKVRAGGAMEAEVISLDAGGVEDGRVGVEVRYRFRDRASLDRYLSEHAPKLRAEGLARFANEDVRIARTVGEVAYREPEGYSDVWKRSAGR